MKQPPIYRPAAPEHMKRFVRSAADRLQQEVDTRFAARDIMTSFEAFLTDLAAIQAAILTERTGD